ncbi:uncharacterized protein LOC111032442 [Myzus persicae]|uniref:uncharacterized protein LOC111032442 n=1 Tax=Myzus persicae TaxID=13164 RepID=UPI000B932CC8|nr:uncharacterized protein LOC111032442 [Myzus persicae]
MVNKCSVTGCKSLYSKDNTKVRLHRFPLSNPETLPLWIAATGREKDWTPCKSSRLCGNHFENSEYIIGHGKNVLKTTSVPTIDYRVEVMKYQKKKLLNVDNDDELMIKPKVKQEESSDTNVEIVQLDYSDMYNLKYEHQNQGKNDDHGESYYKNEDEKCTNKNLNFSNLETSYDNEHDSSHDDEAVKNEYEDFNYELKNDICNRENQCYMFTSSFKEGVEPIVLTPPEDKPPEESLNIMTIDQATADLNFKKIMALKLKKQRRTKDIYSLYFKTLKKKRFRKQEKYKQHYSNNDEDSFSTFIGAQMKELRPFRKVYLSAKHRIQKVLMQAQLKIAELI